MNIHFKIDRDVPPPAQGSGRYQKYPFPQMAVGDSFFAPGIDKKIGNRLRSSSSWWAIRHGRNTRFSVRKVSGGYRCWRVA